MRRVMSPERMDILAFNEEYLSETVMQDVDLDMSYWYEVISYFGNTVPISQQVREEFHDLESLGVLLDKSAVY